MGKTEKVLSYKDALRIANEMNEKLDCYAFTVDKKSRVILIEHYDGSRLELHSCCLKKISDDWFVVFTEHNGIHVYHTGDVYRVREWMEPKTLIYDGRFSE